MMISIGKIKNRYFNNNDKEFFQLKKSKATMLYATKVMLVPNSVNSY